MNRDESIEQGLVAEQSFFDNTEPWRGLPDKSLLGTKNLRVKLAELQMNVTIGMEYTDSGDDEEGDIESRDDDEVNKINIINELSRWQTPKDKISPKD